MYVEQRTETTTASPATFVVKMSRVGLGYSAHSHTPIVSEDHLFMSLCPLQISASNKQLKGALLAGYVISLSVLLESWTYLSGEIVSLSHTVLNILGNIFMLICCQFLPPVTLYT